MLAVIKEPLLAVLKTPAGSLSFIGASLISVCILVLSERPL